MKMRQPPGRKMTDVSDQKMADHTVKAFDADLAKMTHMIAAMGDLTEQAIERLPSRRCSTAISNWPTA